MVRRTIIFILLVLVVGYGAAEVWVKGYAEGRIEEEVAALNPTVRRVEAEVSVPLLFEIIGRAEVSRVEVSTTQVDLGPFIADRVTAILRNVAVDRWPTLIQREPVIQSIERVDTSVEFTSEQASRVLPQGWSFVFNPGGTAAVRGPGFEVSGRLEVLDSSIRFAPDPGVAMPGGVAAPRWSFGPIPFVTCLRSVRVSSGLARVTCSVDDPPARLP
jgi:hypothetical protein